MNKKQVAILWILISMLVPLFLYNLYKIGEWKETDGHTYYSIHDAKDRERVLKITASVGLALMSVGSLLFYVLGKKKASSK